MHFAPFLANVAKNTLSLSGYLYSDSQTIVLEIIGPYQMDRYKENQYILDLLEYFQLNHGMNNYFIPACLALLPPA